MNYIYYHGADNDGKSSGAVVYRAIKNDGPNKLVPIDYGLYNFEDEYEKWNDGDKVYLVDFSFEKDNMARTLEKLGKNFIFIDHHQTAIDDIKELDIEGLRRVGTAACRLCWEYFFPDEDEPESIKLIGVYDVWDLNAKVEVFQLGVSLLDLSPNSQNWAALFRSQKSLIDDICKQGEIVQKYSNIEFSKIADKGAFEIEFEGQKAICINGLKLNSKSFDSVFDPKKYDMMIAFGKTKKPNIWSLSFYSKQDTGPDISVIAKKYGGGGHRNASGCEMTTDKITNLLNL